MIKLDGAERELDRVVEEAGRDTVDDHRCHLPLGALQFESIELIIPRGCRIPERAPLEELRDFIQRPEDRFRGKHVLDVCIDIDMRGAVVALDANTEVPLIFVDLKSRMMVNPREDTTSGHRVETAVRISSWNVDTFMPSTLVSPLDRDPMCRVFRCSPQGKRKRLWTQAA